MHWSLRSALCLGTLILRRLYCGNRACLGVLREDKTLDLQVVLPEDARQGAGLLASLEGRGHGISREVFPRTITSEFELALSGCKFISQSVHVAVNQLCSRNTYFAVVCSDLVASLSLHNIRLTVIGCNREAGASGLV